MKNTHNINRSNPLVARAVDVMKCFKYVERVILLESYVKGKNTKYSDVNFVVMAPEINYDNWQTLLKSTQRMVKGVELDINRFEKANDYLIKKIVQDGVIVYRRNTL